MREKIILNEVFHQEGLKLIKQKISGCFGNVDGIFASHPNDRERAYQLRTIAFECDVTLQEMKEIFLEYFSEKNFDSEHVEKQLFQMVKMFKVKLK